MTPGFLRDDEYAAQLAAGERAVEARDLAFAFADAGAQHLLRDVCLQVAAGGHEWLDTKQVTEPRHLEPVALAVRYLQLRGMVELHPAFPHLVRFIATPEGSAA
ncbi:MAG: hypothetical protein HOQ02_04575 [Lysobacter sp.]|nr:hypothetical protein [Lysobacter sp.]